MTKNQPSLKRTNITATEVKKRIDESCANFAEKLSDKPQAYKPTGKGWGFTCFVEAGMAWQHVSGVCAISSVVWVNDEHEPELHWEWLVSFSVMGRQSLSNKQLKSVLKDWNMQDFEEDNHEPGIARKFWLAVEQRFRKPCPCKDEIIKSEGEYFWSEKKDIKNGR